MEAAEPCNVCNNTDLKLIDGFYYCVECGTQNTNIRETIVESQTLGDGTFALLTRRKIVEQQSGTIEMSNEWYKWHAFNFVLAGLADELISLGAKPCFKTKLLWIWTRYVKKYQNKDDLRQNQTHDQNTDTEGANTFFVSEENSNQSAENLENTNKIQNKTLAVLKDIDFISRNLLIAMLYLALNFDNSDIQLSHLHRFIKEKHISIQKAHKFIPKEIPVKSIPKWLNFLNSRLMNTHGLRAISMSLLRTLDLGPPIVPNLRKLIDNYFQELCLPNDLKPLVSSLMYYHSCNYLDLSKKDVLNNPRIPDYELTVMTYVLIALKMCFGLDCKYEEVLSDAVDKINESRGLGKSHRIGKFSSASERLFSFREWCKYLQFRNLIVHKHLPNPNTQHYLDIDEHTYFEKTEAEQKNEVDLIDKISMDLIAKIPQEDDFSNNVIPKDLFLPTLTPMFDYTEIIVDHCQDLDKRLLLTEDFTQYSAKYACEHLNLQENDTGNLINGVSGNNKTFNKLIRGSIKIKKSNTEMVFVKHCDNKNWIITNQPTKEHVVTESTVVDTNDKDSDHGYDSEYNTSDKESHLISKGMEASDVVSKEKEESDVVSKEKEENHEVPMDLKSKDHNIEPICDNFTVTCQMGNEKDSEKVGTSLINNQDSRINALSNNEEPSVNINQDYIIEKIIDEEDSDKLIFDDNFEELNIKDDVEQNAAEELWTDGDHHSMSDMPPNNDIDDLSDNSTYYPPFNPDNFDRQQVIKELILNACKKYKIPIPPEYKTKEPRKRKLIDKTSEVGTTRERKAKRLSPGEAKKRLEELINGYYNNIQFDILSKLERETNLAIQNANVEHLNSINIENNQELSRRLSLHSDNVNQDAENNVNRSVNEENVVNNTIDEVHDENTEAQLFEDEYKVNLDELNPKCDPKFDEEKYDIKQMYVKVKDDPENEDDIFAIEDPDLDEILLKKIEENKHSAKFKDLKVKLKKKDKNEIEFDSEDEQPISKLIEIDLLKKKSKKYEKSFETLVNVDVPEFKYWCREYDPRWMFKSEKNHRIFDEEIRENTPASFYFVIQQCASVINCSTFDLYKNMQILEQQIIAKPKYSGFEDSEIDKNISDQD